MSFKLRLELLKNLSKSRESRLFQKFSRETLFLKIIEVSAARRAVEWFIVN